MGQADWLDTARPYLAGGGAVRNVDIDEAQWFTGPQRHEAGTPNVVGVAAIAAACEALTVLGDLGHAEDALTVQLRDGLEAIEGVDTLRIWEGDRDVLGIVSLRSPGMRRRLSPPTCQPSTVSGCVTDDSARTRCWPDSARRVVRYGRVSGWAPRPATSRACSARSTNSSGADRAWPTSSVTVRSDRWTIRARSRISWRPESAIHISVTINTWYFQFDT